MVAFNFLRFVVLLSILSGFLAQDADQTCSSDDGSCAAGDALQPSSCEDTDESCPVWAEAGEVRDCGRGGGHCSTPFCFMKMAYTLVSSLCSATKTRTTCSKVAS